jgi:hypothetical protein
MKTVTEIKWCSQRTSRVIRELAIFETGTNILARETNVVALTEHREAEPAKKKEV